MAQAGYTPISLYYSTTAAAVPTSGNLANGELGINIQDEKLYFKNAAGTVKLLASNATSAPVLTFSAGTTGFTPNTATSGAITLAGTLGTANGGTGLTSFTSGGVVYASSTSALATGSALTFDGTNLGLAVTPSAWGSNWKAMQFIGNGSVVGRVDTLQLNMILNAFQNGTDFKYLSTGFASRYVQNGGAHQWINAPSGTAGDTVTFTTAMTLNASGNLGIGTTSPSVRLDVVGSSGIRVNEDGSGTKIITIRSDWAGVDPAINVTTNNSLLLMTNNTERARIDTSGNLLVGGTSNPVGARILSENASGNQLALRYTSIATYYNSVDSSGNLIWTKDGTERARITAGGYFKASDTGTYASSTGTYHEFVNSSADNLIKFRNSNASNPYGFPISYSAASPNGTGNAFWDCDDTGGARGAFRSNGGLANYSANNVNLSDRREKTNFAPATSYLDKICAIPVQTFNYIDQNLEEDGGLTLGVVAQDVQAVAPELVMESNWAKQGDEPKMRLSIYQTDLQYALMKCIQEQQAIIESLKARLDAANL